MPHCVVFYTRANCNLCDVAREVVLAEAAVAGIEVEFRNVEDSDRWLREFGPQVPVAFFGTTKLFKYHVELSRLRRILGTAAAPPAPP